MQRVAQLALEPVAIEQPVGLHVPDHRLDHLAALEQPLQARRQSARVAQDQPGLGLLRHHSAIAAIAQHRRRCRVGEDLDLFQGFCQRVPVVRAARVKAVVA